MKEQKADKMFCPYAVHRSETLQSLNQELLANDGSHGNIVTQVFHNKAEFAECVRERAVLSTEADAVMGGVDYGKQG